MQRIDSPAPSPWPARWLLLAVGALAASTLCAVVLVLLRLPGLAQRFPDAMGATLVLHVDLSTLVWFLTFACALWSLGAPAAVAWVMRLAFGLTCAGVAMMLAAPLLAPGPALLANYVPVVDSPLFLAGLSAFAAGIAVAALSALAGLRPWRCSSADEALALGARVAALPVVAALATAAWTALQAPPALPALAWFESLSWAAGHLLQFTNTALMVACWLWLADAAGISTRLGPRWRALACALAAAPVLLAPLILTLTHDDLAAQRRAFTSLMAWGTWPAPLAVATLLLPGLLGARGRSTHAAPCLAASMALFVLGIVLGAATSDDSTMVPAHYHACIGAVSLAFMGVALQGLPQLGFRAVAIRSARRQVLLYATGVAALALGFGWSGVNGAARKAGVALEAAQDAAQLAGLVLVVLGGLAAITATSWFALLVLRSTWRVRVAKRHLARPAPGQRGVAAGRADRRLVALLLTASLIVTGGMVVALTPGNGVGTGSAAALVADPTPAARSPAERARLQEIDQRFNQAVVMLHAKQYEHAVTALHRVLLLAPELPEAHVNMGYAMLGLNRMNDARAFFEGAIALRPEQANAYYGLALAWEAAGDRALATGAMRTYVHLARQESPEHLSRARAALWEWQAQANAKR